MLRIAALAAAFLVACSTAQARAPARAAGSQPAGDSVRQINVIFERWQSAWNAHDIHAFAQLLDEDATWIVWTGLIWRGRHAIEAGHAEAHRTFFRDSSLSIEPKEIRQVARSVVVARLFATVGIGSAGAETTVLEYKLVVLTRRRGAWRVLYCQTTRLTPAEAAKLR